MLLEHRIFQREPSHGKFCSGTEIAFSTQTLESEIQVSKMTVELICQSLTIALKECPLTKNFLAFFLSGTLTPIGCR